MAGQSVTFPLHLRVRDDERFELADATEVASTVVDIDDTMDYVCHDARGRRIRVLTSGQRTRLLQIVPEDFRVSELTIVEHAGLYAEVLRETVCRTLLVGVSGTPTAALGPVPDVPAQAVPSAMSRQEFSRHWLAVAGPRDLRTLVRAIGALVREVGERLVAPRPGRTVDDAAPPPPRKDGGDEVTLSLARYPTFPLVVDSHEEEGEAPRVCPTVLDVEQDIEFLSWDELDEYQVTDADGHRVRLLLERVELGVAQVVPDDLVVGDLRLVRLPGHDITLELLPDGVIGRGLGPDGRYATDEDLVALGVEAHTVRELRPSAMAMASFDERWFRSYLKRDRS